MYQWQYCTIISTISESDDNCETRYAEPEIGTAGSSATRRSMWVDGYGSGFGPPRVRGSSVWRGLEPNRPMSEFHTPTVDWLLGPVANTTRTNLPLNTCRWLTWNTFGTRMRFSMHLCHSFATTVQLHLHCQQDLHCHHLWLQWTSLEHGLI